jgi:hypothetical protein
MAADGDPVGVVEEKKGLSLFALFSPFASFFKERTIFSHKMAQKKHKRGNIHRPLGVIWCSCRGMKTDVVCSVVLSRTPKITNPIASQAKKGLSLFTSMASRRAYPIPNNLPD